MKTKKFNLSSVILSVICVIFSVESAAPAATLGNSQYFWWLFMIVAFLIPYGLIASELGTTYQSEGGICDWINKAFPKTKWGARASWYYWVNFPLWMASLAVMIPWLLGVAFNVEFSFTTSLLIQLGFIAVLSFAACFPISESIIVLNVSAIIKIFIALLIGSLGIYHVMTHGVVNDMSPITFLPSFDVHSLSFISVIMFGMLGFEVVCTYADSMSDPKKQIPQAIITGGLVVAAIYLFSGFGVGAGIPTQDIQTDLGMLDAFMIITGKETSIFISIIALLFGLTFVGNMVSWSTGINSTAAYAADNNDMPKVFAKRLAKNNVPIGGVIMTAIVATVIVVLGAGLELYYPDTSLFWSFFALNLVSLLLSYIPVFPAFYRLRQTDKDRHRPYKVPGGKWVLRLMVASPVILILTSIFFTIVPLEFGPEALAQTLPITIGMIVVAIIGEVLILLRKKRI